MKEKKNIFTERRSIRRFESTAIEIDKLTEILEAARWAPSWGNTQCCELVVIQENDVKKELSKNLSRKNPATLSVKNAPVVIAVCGALKKSGYYSGKALTKFEDWIMFDLGIVTQNISLAAHNLGLGSVIIGAFNHDKVKELLEIPTGYEIVALIPLGYPNHDPPPPKRKELEEFIHQEKFGQL